MPRRAVRPTAPTIGPSTLDVYQRTFHFADAGGPFASTCSSSSTTCSSSSTTTTGGGSATVTVTNPDSQTGTVGTPVSLQINTSDTDGGSLTYTATGLPAGLSINPSSGLISGTLTTSQMTRVTVTATDASGPSASTTFNWTITPSGGRGSPVAAITAGSDDTCALLSAGGIDCWGYNGFGQLGTACQTDFPKCAIPVAVTGITNATAISGAGSEACALLSTGGIDCWGDNASGELGNDSNVSFSDVPVEVVGIP